MANCPFCGHPIDNSNSESASCPHCGKERLAGQSGSQTINVGRDQDSASAGSTTLDYSDGNFEPNPSGQKTDRDDGSETVRKPPRPQSPDSPNPPLEKSPHSSTGQIREFVRSAAISQARPTATIQQNDNRRVHIGSLVLQRRSLASQSDPSADQSDYRIVGSVGEGGMGMVYSAQQTSVRRDVAIKTLKPDFAYDEKERKKFLKEACITAGLDHPNIVPVHDLGINDEGTLFYSMKLIRGDEWIEVMKKKSRTENLDILLSVCDAIGFAHSRGFMHRDIKAENVMLGSFGEVLVTDWGLAVELNSPSGFSFGGSPAYMAPEMASHQVKKIGVGTDIYLLGATLYVIVTGQSPHPGRTATECVMAAAENKVREYQTSDALLDVALRAMSTQVADRYQTVADLQAAIRNYQSQMESIAFTENGIRLLQTAVENSDFEAFPRAVFSFQDAIRLWPENLKAVELEREAKLEYARCALQQKNFDLGLSVLEPETDEELRLHRRLVKGQTESRKWKVYLKLARTAAVVAGIIAVIGFVVSVLLWQNSESLKVVAEDERDRADLAAVEAGEQRDIARANATEMKIQKERADTEAIEAGKQRDIAKANEKEMEKQKGRADTEAIEAGKQRDIAKANETEMEKEKDRADLAAIEAGEQRDLAKQRLSASLLGRFAANIKYAGAELSRAKTGNAIETLDRIRQDPQLAKKDRGWELHRLYQLCHENDLENMLSLPGDTTVQFFESSSDGKTQLVVLSDGSVWKRTVAGAEDSYKQLEKIRLTVSDERTVSSISVSPNGKLMAVGYLGNQLLESVADSLEIWDLPLGTATQMEAQKEAELGVRFVGFLDNDRVVTVSDKLSHDRSRPLRKLHLWDLAKKNPVDQGRMIISAKASALDRWSLHPGLKKFAYAKNRKDFIELIVFSFDGQENVQVPVQIESDLTSLAVVETELDVSGFACICGLSDGSLVLPIKPKGRDARIKDIGLARVTQLAANAHANAVTGLDVFREYVISSSPNGDLGVWTWSNSNLVKKTTLLGHTAKIAGVAVDLEQRIITSVDRGNKLPVRGWPLTGLQDEQRLGGPWSRANASIPVCGALAAPTQRSFVSLVGNTVGELQILRPGGSGVVQPLNTKMKTEDSRFVYDAERDWIVAVGQAGESIIWSAKTGKRLESIDGESERPVLDYQPVNSRFLTPGDNVGKIAVREKDSIRNVIGQFQSTDQFGETGNYASIQTSKLSNDGTRIAICAGDDSQPIISLLNVGESGKLLGWCAFGTKFSRTVSSMMFEPVTDELVVAFRLPSHQVEVSWLQPNENRNLYKTAKKNVIAAPDSFDETREFDLFFVGQLESQSVTIVREFTSPQVESKQEKAVAQIWSQPIWKDGATPDRSIPLGEVHPDTRFEMTGTVLTYIDPDGRPFQVDLSAKDATGKEIGGIADAIGQDIRPGKKRREITRECKWLPGNKLLIAGMSHAWILEKNSDQQWVVIFRNLPTPQCRYVGLSKDGRSGMVHHADGRIHLFQGNLFEADPALVALDGFYDLAGLSTDGKQIAVYDRERGLRFLDFAASLANENATANQPVLDSILTESPLTTLAWSPDGLVVGGASRNGDIHLWDVSNGNPWVQPKTGLGADTPIIEKISISPPNLFDQRVVSVIDSKQQLQLFATRSNAVGGNPKLKERVWTIGPKESSFDVVESARFNPNFSENGFRIATGLDNSLVEVWLVDVKDQGFLLDEETRNNQLFRVYDFPVTTREMNVIAIGFDPSGRNLGTLTAENMTVWLTSGWNKDKPEPIGDDKPASVSNVAQ